MHVALYSPGWPFENATSGIVTYVHWVRTELQRMGHRVSLITATRQRDEAERIYGIDSGLLRRMVRRLRLKLGIDRDLVFTVGSRIAEEAVRIHRRDPIDVLEMEESFGWAADVISRNRFPLVVKLHGPAFLTIPQDEADSQAGFVRRRIAAEGAGLAAARVITAPSQCTLESAIARYALEPAIRTKVVNPLALDPGARLWSAHASRRDTILFVGRFDKAKGADRVLLGFRELLAQRPELRLDFVGPDMGIRAENGTLVYFEDYVRSLFSASDASKINYLGRQSRDVISSLRCKAAVTIVASRWETQGYTALEAMLQGCPLVCADTSGLSEAVEHGVTGLLFQSDDVAEIARHVRVLLDDAEMAQNLGRRAREYVLATHAPSRVVAQTLDVYRAAISDFRRHGSRDSRH